MSIPGRPERVCFGFIYMGTVKTFVRADGGKIVCVCLQKNKRCKRWCEKVDMKYDEFQGIKHCFYHNEEVKYFED